MIFVVVLTAVSLILLTIFSKLFNFFDRSSYPKNHLPVIKSKHSNASDEGDDGDRSHTFFRNCEKTTTEAVTGEITGKNLY